MFDRERERERERERGEREGTRELERYLIKIVQLRGATETPHPAARTDYSRGVTTLP